jgi:DNA-binding NarL/FixJ family response regulator
MKADTATLSRISKHKVLVVDDHPVVREGLTERINRESDLVVCGEAQSAPEALRAIVRLQPDIVVLDLSLPKGHGLELIKDIRVMHPRLPVLVFTMHEESLYAERALRAGAQGYVTKQEPPGRLLSAIRAVLRGGYSLSPEASSGLMQNLLHHPGGAQVPSITGLTDRELEIFELIGQGVGTREIAARLGRSVKTIETHRARLKEKFQLKSATELVCRASRWVQTGQ